MTRTRAEVLQNLEIQPDDFVVEIGVGTNHSGARTLSATSTPSIIFIAAKISSTQHPC